jgi:predicted Zn-dependent protease
MEQQLRGKWIFRSVRQLILFGMVLCFSVATMAFSLNDLGKLTTDLVKLNEKVSTEEEITIGGNLISGLLGAAPLVDNPELQHYVNDVGFWVASQSERKGLPWKFGVIDSNGINAFAAPGGYVVITIGLYNLLDNEAQLAGVLAHEISHVVEKHHLNALQKNRQVNILAKLGSLALEKDGKDIEAANALVNAGVQLYSTGLDRKLEYDADLRGVVLAARAGYDPYALLDVLTTIDSINPSAPSLAVMLKTHPPTAERLDRMANAMDGKLEQYADGQINSARFLEVVGDIKP